MTTVLTGSQVDVFRARTLATALRIYARTGMTPNRAYTPTNMLRTAGTIVGQTFKRGAYLDAAAALTRWAEDQSAGVAK